MADVAELLALLDRVTGVTRTTVVPTLQRAEQLIESARHDLQTFDEPTAREAADQAADALDTLRNVIYGWLPDYQRISSQLQTRMRE